MPLFGSDSDLSLRGGDTENEGNIYVNGSPVCDDSWEDVDAKVACRSVTYLLNFV